MKKLLGIVVLGLMWCNTAQALTQQEAIDRYLSGRKLDLIEGIWIADRGRVAVFYKSGNKFYCRAIRSNQVSSGEEYCSLTKGSQTIYYGRMYEQGKNEQLDVSVSLNRVQFRYYWNNVPDSYGYDRIWPVDLKEPTQPGPDDNKVVAASMGSGFFVTRAGHLVTNYHVIEECNKVKTNIFGKEILTDIIAVDKTNDLAIIKAEMKPSKVFPVSNEDVSLLQDVIVAGFPLGKKVSSAIKIHKGTVTALAGFGDNYSNFQTDATINQGNSGGPIINQKGNVVGVAVQLIAAEHAQNIFFGVKSSTLKTFANANNIKFLTPNYRELSNEDLGNLITEATVFLECWMTVAKIKQIIAQEENRKAFYSEHK